MPVTIREVHVSFLLTEESDSQTLTVRAYAAQHTSGYTMLPSYEFQELRLELVLGEAKRARNMEQR